MTRKKKYLIFGVGVLIACVSSFMFNRSAQAADESLTLETYYPAPYGIYSELTTTNSTYLATEGGNVGIGTDDPQAKLEVAGGIKIGSDNDCDGDKEGTMRWNTTTKAMEYCNGTSWGSSGDLFWFGNAGANLKEGAESSQSCTIECGSSSHSGGCPVPMFTVNAEARVNGGVVQTRVTGDLSGTTGNESCGSGWVSANTASCTTDSVNTYTGTATAKAQAVGVLAKGVRSGSTCSSVDYWK